VFPALGAVIPYPVCPDEDLVSVSYVLRSRALGIVVVGAVLTFGAWTAWLSSSVSSLRERVEERVGWMRAIGNAETRDAALAAMEQERALRDDVRSARATLARGEDPARALTATLRGETRDLSIELGERWEQLELLAGLAIFLAALAGALLLLLRRRALEVDELNDTLAQRVLDLESQDAALEAQLGELDDRERLLRTVAGSIVHEINNPLCFLTMTLGALEEELEELDVPEPQKRGLLEMSAQGLEGADRVTQLSRDLRDLTKRRRTDHGPLEVREILESAARLSRGRIGAERSIHIEAPELPPVVGERLRLEQVFLNLLINAGDAMRDAASSGDIRVTAEVDDTLVCISVRDRGPGISLEDLDRVFEPFFTTKGEAGTGLGLYVSRQIIRDHGGHLTILSDGEGTEVRVLLPVASKRET